MRTHACVSAYDARGKKFIHVSEQTIEKVLQILKKKNNSVDLYFLTPRKMHEINLIHKGKDKPTNILSFEPNHAFVYSPESSQSLGEIYLCVSVIEREVKEYGMESTEARIRELIVHGILHLVGYTHTGKRDIIEMQKKEREILSKIHAL